MTTSLFSIILVFLMSYSFSNIILTAEMSSNLLMMIILFITLSTSPRFISIEKDRKTFPFLRTFSNMETIFKAKAIYATILNAFNLLVVSLLFFIFTLQNIPNLLLFIPFIFILSFNLCSVILFCSIISESMSPAWIYSNVLSIPLIIPQLIYATQILYVIQTDITSSSLIENILGLIGFSLLKIFLLPSFVKNIYG